MTSPIPIQTDQTEQAALPPVSRPLPATPRSVRVDDELWDEVTRTAKADGLAVSDVIRHYLRGYVAASR